MHSAEADPPYTLLKSEMAKMEPEHLCQLLEGRQWLHSVGYGLLDEFLGTMGDDFCSRKGANGKSLCKANLDDWLHDARIAWRYCDPLWGKPLPLDTCYALCLSCEERVTKICGGVRRYIWDELPYAFGLKAREAGKSYEWRDYLWVFLYVVVDSLSKASSGMTTFGPYSTDID